MQILLLSWIDTQKKSIYSLLASLGLIALIQIRSSSSPTRITVSSRRTWRRACLITPGRSICIQMAFRTPAKTRLLLAGIRGKGSACGAMLCVSGRVGYGSVSDPRRIWSRPGLICRFFGHVSSSDFLSSTVFGVVSFFLSNQIETKAGNFIILISRRSIFAFHFPVRNERGRKRGFSIKRDFVTGGFKSARALTFSKSPNKARPFLRQRMYVRLKRNPGLIPRVPRFRNNARWRVWGIFNSATNWESDKGRWGTVEILISTFLGWPRAFLFYIIREFRRKGAKQSR